MRGQAKAWEEGPSPAPRRNWAGEQAWPTGPSLEPRRHSDSVRREDTLSCTLPLVLTARSPSPPHLPEPNRAQRPPTRVSFHPQITECRQQVRPRGSEEQEDPNPALPGSRPRTVRHAGCHQPGLPVTERSSTQDEQQGRRGPEGGQAGASRQLSARSAVRLQPVTGVGAQEWRGARPLTSPRQLENPRGSARHPLTASYAAGT